MALRSIAVNLIARDNGSGLTRDTQLVAEILEAAGWSVSHYSVGKSSLRHKVRRVTTAVEQQASQWLRQRPRYDINLFIEDVVPRWLPFARKNCLIPNQEWFRQEWKPYLLQFDAILCKTRLAEMVFSPFAPTEFISFSSFDRRRREISPNYDRCFHLGTTSSRLGTTVLLDLWRSRPDFPKLTLVRQQPPPSDMRSDNIDYIDRLVSEESLATYQNHHGIHIYPTQMEGFGHRLVEAMSCEGLTVTTDAPPMNEIVTSERGVLVEYATAEPHLWGTKYQVTRSTLERALETVWGYDEAQRREFGKRGRSWYEENDRFFRRRLVEALQTVL
ncbi:glycosyltransferase [Baaleninema simplex]|uniref:glycosyltransferase n=1 Tax=Baaleninema simplex TaxID=2862350 RepID=UPI00034AA3F2|nr:glycosyltransferase [Baaleninema simplex]